MCVNLPGSYSGSPTCREQVCTSRVQPQQPCRPLRRSGLRQLCAVTHRRGQEQPGPDEQLCATSCRAKLLQLRATDSGSGKWELRAPSGRAASCHCRICGFGAAARWLAPSAWQSISVLSSLSGGCRLGWSLATSDAGASGSGQQRPSASGAPGRGRLRAAGRGHGQPGLASEPCAVPRALQRRPHANAPAQRRPGEGRQLRCGRCRPHLDAATCLGDEPARQADRCKRRQQLGRVAGGQLPLHHPTPLAGATGRWRHPGAFRLLDQQRRGDVGDPYAACDSQVTRAREHSALGRRSPASSLAFDEGRGEGAWAAAVEVAGPRGCWLWWHCACPSAACQCSTWSRAGHGSGRHGVGCLMEALAAAAA
mmetsp:Transcript_103507/g.259494  ORF Transcript_103507/g.259494 Transcript_103507/m.259494 type:complete len:367 (+) Transcript_103507:836-1936(+)